MRFRPEIDYYEILQVHPRASQEMVKKAYRTLMGEMGGHPDLGGDENRAKLMNEAYTVLADPDLRHAYDRARAARSGWAGGRPTMSGGPAPGLEQLAGVTTKVLLTGVIVVVAMMIARFLENPVIDIADLIAMLVVVARVWGPAAVFGRR
jgi:DnaJ domain